ncbi:MAG: GspE/PulE family protein, partial [Rubrobacter sp.]
MTEKASSERTSAGGDRLGEILVASGKVSRAQLDEALAALRGHREGRQLGQILLSAGHVDAEDLAMALAKKLRLEFVELTENDVDRAVTPLVDRKVLRRHGVLPLRVENGRLIVATSDPTNFYAFEDLEILTGYPVRPVVAVEDEIQRVFNRVHALGEDVSRMLEEAAEDSSERTPGDVELGGDVDAENAPIVRLVASILQRAVGEGASDIHVEPRAGELAVRLRVDGVLREVMRVPPR